MGPRSKSLAVRQLHVKHVGRFEDFSLSFGDRLNIISGGNGVGKSTILQIIAASFSIGHQTRNVSRRALSETSGAWKLEVTLDGRSHSGEMQVDNKPPQFARVTTQLSRVNQLLIFLQANRGFDYQELSSVNRDPGRENHEISSQTVEGLKPTDMKRWLVNRYLFKAVGDLKPDQLTNLDLAISFFSLLDPSVRFQTVDPRSFDVVVDTPAGAIPHELLSSGFRSSLAILIGLINEIEIRGFEGPASDFSGCILIDEIDLHLHPSWQRVIAQALTSAFPHAQFIVTTHSPHVIQNADAGEVIALRVDDDGRTFKAELPVSRRGFKGWTLEEILVDVMGLNDAVSEAYKAAVQAFDDAIDDEDPERVAAALSELNELVHPNSEMRKLFRIQAAPFLGN
jgi:Fe-S cluster assembly ATPase SufC